MQFKVNFHVPTKKWRIYNADSGPLVQHALVESVVFLKPCRVGTDLSGGGYVFIEGELTVSGDVATIGD